MGGSISITRIRNWVENNVNMELGADIQQYLEDKNIQNIEISFTDVDEVKWKRVDIRNLSKNTVLLSFAEKFLADFSLSTEALKEIDKVQESENFGRTDSITNIDDTIINSIGLARYLQIKQQVRLELSQTILTRFTRVKKVNFQDIVIRNDNYVDAVYEQLIDEVAGVDSKVADELREKIDQKDVGIKFGEIAWILFGVAGILGVVYLLRSNSQSKKQK